MDRGAAANLALALIVATAFVVCGWLVVTGHPVFGVAVLVCGMTTTISRGAR